MKNERHPHTLNASVNLLTISFVIIGGLKFSNLSDKSYSDEVAWVSAAFLFVSTLLAYMAIRSDDAASWQGNLADWTFLAGLLTLMGSFILAVIFL